MLTETVVRTTQVVWSQQAPARPLSATIQRVNGLNLHVVEAGPANGPLVFLLHGFPDFWWSWRHQIAPLANQGFRVLVPDQRGYNLSDKPQGRTAYRIDTLAADVISLANAYNYPTFRLVGHDWGGVVAWWLALHYPMRLDRLAILNAPHPEVWGHLARRRLTQALRSTYVAFFQLPWLPEFLLKLGNFAALRWALTRSSQPGSFTPADLARYVEAWSQPGALTAMLNYYRALRNKPSNPQARVHPPTLLLWGQQDVALEPAVAEASLALCERGEGFFLPNAGHWVQLDEPQVINNALERFLLAV